MVPHCTQGSHCMEPPVWGSLYAAPPPSMAPNCKCKMWRCFAVLRGVACCDQYFYKVDRSTNLIFEKMRSAEILFFFFFFIFYKRKRIAWRTRVMGRVISRLPMNSKSHNDFTVTHTNETVAQER